MAAFAVRPIRIVTATAYLASVLLVACGARTEPRDAAPEMAAPDASPADAASIDACRALPAGTSCGCATDSGFLPPVGNCDGIGRSLCQAEADDAIRGTCFAAAFTACTPAECLRADHCYVDADGGVICRCGADPMCVGCGLACVSPTLGAMPRCQCVL